MDALRRAEAGKKAQEARAARTVAQGTPDPAGILTRVAPAVVVAPAVDAASSPAALAAAVGASVPAGELELELEPLEVSVAKLRASRDAHGNPAGGAADPARSERADPTATRWSTRGLASELTGYFEASPALDPPRANARNNEITLEDARTHTVVDAQTVFQAGERRPRPGRVVGIAGALAAIIVLGITALGVYYAQLQPTPLPLPSPAVAAGVEKPPVKPLPVVPPGDGVTGAVAGDSAAGGHAAAALTTAPAVAITQPVAALAEATIHHHGAVPVPMRPAPAASDLAPTAPPAEHSAPAPSTTHPPARAQAAASSAEEVASGTVRIARSGVHSNQDAVVNAAYAAFQRGDFEHADTLYRAVGAAEPDRRDALLGLGALALKRGDLTSAYEHYSTVLKRYPDDPVASAALFSLTGGDGAAAAARLRLLLDSHGDAAYLRAALGHYWARRSQWGDAQQAYFDAVRLDAANADYAYDLAVSLDHLGQAQAALGYYQKSLTLADRQPASFNPASVLDRIKSLTATAAPAPTATLP